jgi:phospholipid/cholesterol/gamma-HCH transport system substrate-binding protein
VRFRSVATKLVIFALFTGTVTIILASNIGNFALFKNRYPVSAVFDDVTGLLSNDPVTLAGVTIGKVTGQHVEKGRAVVDFSIDKSVKLPTSTTVEIRYRNLLGLRVVNLTPGDGAPPFLRPKERIPREQTQGPLDLDTVFNSLRPLLTGINANDINTISKALVVSFAKHKDDIDAVLADTATFLGALAGKNVQLGSLVDNLGAVATSVADEREQLQRLLGAFAGVAETLAGDSSQLDRTLVNLNTATGELGRLIKDNRGSLERDLDDLVTVLELVMRHQGDLKQITTHLDDILHATLQVMSFGEWANLYVPALCLSSIPGCDNATPASAANEPRGLSTLLSAGMGGAR